MLIYNYDDTTFEFIGESEISFDGTGEQPVLPNFSTTLKPPETVSNQIAVFDNILKNWTIMDDFRGIIYYDIIGMPYKITEIGFKVPSECLLSFEPPKYTWFYTIVDHQWKPKSIEYIRDIKIDEIYKNVSKAIDISLNKYSAGERETWSKMNDECLKFKSDGVVGPHMTAKISSSIADNTAEKLSDVIIERYSDYLVKKYNFEAIRDNHKINISGITDIFDLINYNTRISL